MDYNNDLLVVGHTAQDFIIKVSEFPKANFSTAIDDMKQLYGGAAANVAMIGSKIGLKTSLVSAVGGTFPDSDYYKAFKDSNVNIDDLIIVKDETNPTSFVLTDENGDQISYFYWGAGKEFANSPVPVKAIENVKAVHLATGDPDFNWKCGLEAKKQNKFISFDPGQDLGTYSADRLKDVLKVCDILFGNQYEIERILKELNITIDQLRELGPKIVVKTLGKDGCIVFSQEGQLKIDSIYRPAVDPTGAGDSYRAGFLYCYLNGKSIEYSAKFASSVSSFVVEKLGCQTNMPTYKEALNRMNEFYKE